MWHLIQKDLRLLFSIKRTVFLLGLCLLVFFVMSTIYRDASLQQGVLDRVQVGLVDEENSAYSRLLLQNFQNNEAFSKLFSIEVASLEVLYNRFDQNELTAILIIPAGFTDALLRYENKPIQVLLNPHNTLKNEVLIATLSSFSEYVAAVDAATYSTWEVLGKTLSPDALKRMNDLYSVEMIGFALNRQQFFDFKPIDTVPTATPQLYFLLSIMIILCSFLSVQSALQLNLELEWKCLQRFYVSPRQNLFFFVSKLLTVAAHNGLLILVLALAISLLLSIPIAPLLPFMGMTILLFTAIVLLVATLIPNRELLLNTLSITFVIFAILGGNFIPLQLMPESVQTIARLTPNYWLLQLGLFQFYQATLETSHWLIPLSVSIILLTATPAILKQRGGQ